MNPLLNHPLFKLLVGLLICVGCGGLGWWWHRPDSLRDRAGTTNEQPAPPALLGQATAGDGTIGARILAADPFALRRESAPQAAALPGAAASDVIVWRFAAVTSNRGEHQLVMTAAEQPPLLLKQGDKLPNGERIRSIQATSIQLQDVTGRKRTIQLIEP